MREAPMDEDKELEFYQKQIRKNSQGASQLVLNACLDRLPSAIPKLTQVEELHVCDTNIASLPNDVKNLTNLTTLKLRSNEFKDFPTPICDLDTLQDLDLASNFITQLPEDVQTLRRLKLFNLENNCLNGAQIGHLGQLTHLEVLKLSGNNLSTVPDIIGKLTKLQELNLKHNNLTAAPKFLTKLHNLKVLDISYNRLENFEVDLKPLSELKNLDLEGNKLEKLPDTIRFLTSIERLDVAKNQIETIPSFIVNLNHMKELWLEKNQLTQFPEVVCDVSSLDTISLSGNNLRAVPGSIEKLQKLRYLDLGECGLEEFPKSICSLRNLRWLCLNQNKFTTLPYELTNLQNLLFIYLTENQMKKPPYSICQRGVHAIFNCLQETHKRRALYQKLVFTGSVAAGKTSLARSLISNKSVLVDETERTIVLDRLPWTPERGLNIQLYDFGGHKWYQIVQPFFLDKSAIIVLVVNLATYQRSEYEKHVGSWLSLVQARAPGATVKMVGTNIDRCSTEEASQKVESILEEMKIKEDLEVTLLKEAIEKAQKTLGEVQISRLRASLATRLILPEKMHMVSSKTLDNFDALRAEILDAARQQGKIIPASWQGLLDKVNLATLNNNDKKFLTLPDVRQLSETLMLDPGTQLNDVLSFFHSIGELLWYEHNPAISEFVFHQQEHLISLLKAIFSQNIDQDIANNSLVFLKQQFTNLSLEQAKRDLIERGIMSRALLKGLWDYLSLAPEMFAAMTELLTQFGLCYPMSTEEGSEVSSWRFPFFIRDDPPSNANLCHIQDSFFRFTLEFVFLLRCPSSIYEKVSIRFYKHIIDINSIQHWYCGMTAHILNSHVLLHRHREQKVLSLSVEGADTVELWFLLQRLVKEVQRVLKQWPGVGYEVWYVCPQCMKGGTMESAHRFPGDCIDKIYPVAEQYITCPRENAPVPSHLLFPKEVNVTVPTQELLSAIAMKMGSSEWRRLGRILDLEEYDLEQVEYEEKHLAEVCYQMLLKWLRANGSAATSQVLKKALSKIGREDLTEMIENSQQLPQLQS